MKFLVVAVLLGLAASARARGPYGPDTTFTFFQAPTAGFAYAIACATPGGCPGLGAATTTSIGGNFAFTYTLGQKLQYSFVLYGAAGTGVPIVDENIVFLFTVTTGICVINDPLISGFDGRTFHFDEIGEYVMLESGDGYKVHTTFAGASATNSELEVMEKSWTSSVRLFSPNVTTVAGSETIMLSLEKQSIQLSEMSASVILSKNDGPKYVAACSLKTPTMDIRVDQVSGYEEALKHPDTEAWAAPFTWLDVSFVVKKPLPSPVTGILGATYPADMVAEQYALAPNDAATKTGASMTGEVPVHKTHRRALAATPEPFQPISSGIVGLST
ncbi:hypothetical protein N2152v2_005714 [Parachlorella kessleri]